MVGRNMQLFTFTFGTDSLHKPNAYEKENSETTFAFNEDEGLFGDFRKSHIFISQELEESCAVNAFFAQDSILRFFDTSKNIFVKHTFKHMESGERNFAGVH